MQPTASVSPHARRRGRVPYWVPLVLLIAGSVWLLREVQGRALEAGYERIELGRSAFQDGPVWADPRWQEIVAVELARLGDVHPGDGTALTRASERLRGLPFVRRVSPARVLWPSGVDFDVELRRPVACVRSGSRFYPVDADGVILSGAWSSPPWVDSGYLPFLVDAADAEPFAPGDRLDVEHLVDALDVALSFWLELPAPYRTRIGRIAIDARNARGGAAGGGAAGGGAASGLGPADFGALVLLEGQRAIVFGRPPAMLGELASGAPSPAAHAPGELSSEGKWRHVAAALERLDADGESGDWSHLDVRFDSAAIDLRRADGVLELEGGAHAWRAGLADVDALAERDARRTGDLPLARPSRGADGRRSGVR